MSVEIVPLGYTSVARVWLGELPDFAYYEGKVIEAVEEAQSSAHVEPSCAAVEVKLPKGPRTLYGLLCASFTPDRSGQCIIQVAVDTAFEMPINWSFPDFSREQTSWSLATRLDSVYVGLLEEYAQAVLRGTPHAGQVLGGGLLRFYCAAHGLVGSSEVVFQILARLVVALMARPQELTRPEDLNAMLSAAFSLPRASSS